MRCRASCWADAHLIKHKFTVFTLVQHNLKFKIIFKEYHDGKALLQAFFQGDSVQSTNLDYETTASTINLSYKLFKREL